MQIHRWIVGVAVAGMASAVAWTGFHRALVEGFDGTLDAATWRTGPGDEIVPDGGNGGAFLRGPALTAALPSIATARGVFSGFVGNYRSMGVEALGIDVSVFAASGTGDDRPISLGLRHDAWSPDDPSDDCEMVLSGREVPRPGSDWTSYRFHIPAWKPSMPPRWVAYGECASWPRDDAWNHVVGGHVSEARFYLGDPAASYDESFWDVGYDNAAITLGKFGSGPS